MTPNVLFLTLSLIVLGTPAFSGFAYTDDQCLTCHEATGDKVAELFKRDIHREKGVSCAGCHGGDSSKEEMDASMSKAAGFIGVPKGDDITRACARCHSSAQIMVKEYNSVLPRNQAEAVAGGVHGKLSTTGKERIAQCVTCHNAHGIVKVKNPLSPVNPLNVTKTCSKCHSNASYMRQYNPALAIDQMEKYRTSIHGIRNAKGDMKVAECASCHGSHDIRPPGDVKSKVYPANIPSTCATCHGDAKYMRGYNLSTDQFEKYSKSVHGVALLEKGDASTPTCNDCHGNHGAVPPGVESISRVCGTCHALNASLFAASPHKKAFDARKMPECETCHGYHDIVAATDELLGVSEKAVCSWCHTENENRRGYEVAKTMRQLIDSLGLREKHAAAFVQDAEQKGMEISEAKFKLREIRQARLESRTMVHSFDEQQFRDVVDKGLTTATFVSDEAGKAIDDYYFRRWGLGVASLIITILAVSLYLFIRRIERGQSASK